MRLAPACLVLLAACTSIPLPGGSRERPAPALERKTVAEKREPSELVATDGTSCLTTARRFENAQPGDRVWCVWQGRRGGG